MRIVITGAGQIARGIIAEARAQGHDVAVLRRASDAVPGVQNVVSGDAGDRDVVDRLARDADAILHCVHAAYDPVSWRRELPQRERTVMDVAAQYGIPVVFPESVYAFGRRAEDLVEGTPVDPCSPLGEVRAELLHAREAHPARTISLVAGDLLGPTATTAGSVPTATVIAPVRTGRTAWVLADPDVPHAMTAIPDLARAMLRAAEDALDLAPAGDAVLLAPSPDAISLRELAQVTADLDGRPTPRVRRVPSWPLGLAGVVSPTLRSLHQQRYLWERPTHLQPGALSDRVPVMGWDAALDVIAA